MIRDIVVTVTQPIVAIFVCTAIAWPRPSITWYRVEMDNSYSIVNETVGVSISVVNGDTERTVASTVEFNPSSSLLSAMYVCEATNLVSSAETDATLIVNGRWIECLSPSFQTFTRLQYLPRSPVCTLTPPR